VNEVHLIYMPANCCIGLSQRVFIGHRPYRLARCCCNMRSCGQARALIPRWFSLPDAAQGNAFFRLSLARVLKVVRFRLGCSTLPSVAQRNQGVCRAERVCPCHSGRPCAFRAPVPAAPGSNFRARMRSTAGDLSNGSDFYSQDCSVINSPHLRMRGCIGNHHFVQVPMHTCGVPSTTKFQGGFRTHW